MEAQKYQKLISQAEQLSLDIMTIRKGITDGAVRSELLEQSIAVEEVSDSLKNLYNLALRKGELT